MFFKKILGMELSFVGLLKNLAGHNFIRVEFFEHLTLNVQNRVRVTILKFKHMTFTLESIKNLHEHDFTPFKPRANVFAKIRLMKVEFRVVSGFKLTVQKLWPCAATSFWAEILQEAG